MKRWVFTTAPSPSLGSSSPSKSDSFRPHLPKPVVPLVGFGPPSALPELETRTTRACLTRLLPTSGFCTLLTVYVLQNPPALFHAGHALGVLPSGLFPFAEPSDSFEPGFPPDVGDENLDPKISTRVASPSGPYSLRRSDTRNNRVNCCLWAAALLVFFAL